MPNLGTKWSKQRRARFQLKLAQLKQEKADKDKAVLAAQTPPPCSGIPQQPNTSSQVGYIETGTPDSSYRIKSLEERNDYLRTQVSVLRDLMIDALRR